MDKQKLRLEALKAVSKIKDQGEVYHLLIHTNWVFEYLVSGKMPEVEKTD